MTDIIVAPRLLELMADAVPAIAVSFADGSTAADIEHAIHDGLDVAELRIDRYQSFEPAHVVAEVKRFAALPTIGTIRTRAEGGEWDGSDADRLDLFRRVLPEVDGVDVELSSAAIRTQVVEEAHRQGKVAIVSNHNFDHTPSTPELESMTADAKALGADFVKLSAMAHSQEDVQRLADFTLGNAHQGLIVIAMGGHGSVSRVFFPALGSRLTYAYASKWPVSGQLNFKDTFEMLRRFYPEFNERKIAELEILEDV